MAPIAGYLRMSEKSKRVSSKGKEQFKFMPISTSDVRSRYPRFNPAATTILVTSAAASDKKRSKHRADSHMPDLYVLVEIIEAECKDDNWVAQIVDIIGESNDLASCATALMYHRGLTEENGPLLPRPKDNPAQVAQSKSPPNVFTSGQDATSQGRVDLRPVDGDKNAMYTIFSVDPPGCLDIDDAVHVRTYSEAEIAPLMEEVVAGMGWQGLSAAGRATALAGVTLYEVGVHIADVTNYIKQLPQQQPAAAKEAKPSNAAKPRRTVTDEALHRSFTVYLPHQQIPILPTFLSHDECSLKPGVDKLAMSCLVTVVCTGAPNPANPKCTFKVVRRQFQRSLIRTAGAYTYDQVDDFLSKQQAAAQDGASGVTHIGGAGVREQEFGVPLRSRTAPSADTEKATTAAAAAGGNLSGKAPTSAVKFGLKQLRKLFPTLDSHEIIEQLMLLANTCAAEFLEDQCQRAAAVGADAASTQQLAYLLRRQLPARSVAAVPDLSLEELALQDAPSSASAPASEPVPVPSTAFRGVPVDFTAHPAEYLYCPVAPLRPASGEKGEEPAASEQAVTVPTAVEKAHVSLGARLYTHFTSPIRRYADQVVHALINHYLDTLPASTRDLPDPWLSTFTPTTVAHINLKQKQHKKFSRDMTIVDFVFDQCATAGRNEVTIDAQAVVLPFRFSDKYRAYKTDLYVFAPCEFLYPLKLHTAAQAQLFDITYTDTAVLLQSRQTKEIKRLRVGDRIAVQVHCSLSAASLRKKCVLSSPSITFS